MKCKECKYKILDSVGNTWCKARQCVVSEVLIEKFGCKVTQQGLKEKQNGNN